MAKIVFRQDADGDHDIERLLLADLDKVQQLREHTVHPPGQERYVKPVDEDALQELLVELGDDVTDAAVLLAATVYHDNAIDVDVTLATIAGATDFAAPGGADDEELQAIQDLLAPALVETGNFLLSIDRGVLEAAIEQDWVVVLEDDGTTIFTL